MIPDTILTAVRKWASHFLISQTALKALVEILNTYLRSDLPKDPRTLMKTPRCLEIIEMKDGGKYWHHGLEKSLQNRLKHVTTDLSISININVDGLPIYKSSANHFWPIIANIHELSHIQPMVIGIYYGVSKPKDADEFLMPMIKELLLLLNSGVLINSHRISLKIRAFICDSPARAFIKCVKNFNGKHGCLKCITKGKYSHDARTVVFPKVDAEMRTDQLFRRGEYTDHQRSLSPLTALPIDMVQDVIVSDALHLLELGVMRKLLNAWRTGSMTKKVKWSVQEKKAISVKLVALKLPNEIHRRMRSLDHISLWKGLEYRIFLNYVGVVLLKDYLPSKYYEHFLLLFCAVRICSVDAYKELLPIARILFIQYINDYKTLYGTAFVTSNVHNLCHVVDEVEKFGSLISLSAYPFENSLHSLKKLVKAGPNPLAQVANRVIETEHAKDSRTLIVPDNSKAIHVQKNAKISKIVLPEFTLTNESKNKWFLTKDQKIVGMTDVDNSDEGVLIKGKFLLHKQDFFPKPIKSSFLHIFSSRINNNSSSIELYKPDTILCKMVAVHCKKETVFIPLMHTLKNYK